VPENRFGRNLAAGFRKTKSLAPVFAGFRPVSSRKRRYSFAPSLLSTVIAGHQPMNTD
jgi:hypothetical protein